MRILYTAMFLKEVLNRQLLNFPSDNSQNPIPDGVVVSGYGVYSNLKLGQHY